MLFFDIRQMTPTFLPPTSIRDHAKLFGFSTSFLFCEVFVAKKIKKSLFFLTFKLKQKTIHHSNSQKNFYLNFLLLFIIPFFNTQDSFHFISKKGTKNSFVIIFQILKLLKKKREHHVLSFLLITYIYTCKFFARYTI